MHKTHEKNLEDLSKQVNGLNEKYGFNIKISVRESSGVPYQLDNLPTKVSSFAFAEGPWVYYYLLGLQLGMEQQRDPLHEG